MALDLTAAEKQRLHSLLFQYSGQLVQMSGPAAPIVKQALDFMKQNGAMVTAQVADTVMNTPFVPNEVKQFIKSLVYKAKTPAAPPPPPPTAPPVVEEKKIPWGMIAAAGVGGLILWQVVRKK